MNKTKSGRVHLFVCVCPCIISASFHGCVCVCAFLGALRVRADGKGGEGGSMWCGSGHLN